MGNTRSERLKVIRRSELPQWAKKKMYDCYVKQNWTVGRKQWEKTLRKLPDFVPMCELVVHALRPNLGGSCPQNPAISLQIQRHHTKTNWRKGTRHRLFQFRKSVIIDFVMIGPVQKCSGGGSTTAVELTLDRSTAFCVCLYIFKWW